MTQVVGLSVPKEIFVLIANHLNVLDTIFFSRVCCASFIGILNDKGIQERITNYKIILTKELSDRVQILRGPNGFNGLIAKTYQELQEFKRKLSHDKHVLFLNIARCLEENSFIVDPDQIREFIEFIAQVENVKAITQIDSYATQDTIEIKNGMVITLKRGYVEQERLMLQKEKCILKEKLERMMVDLRTLCGPTGFDGLIDQAFKKMQSMQDAQSKEAFDALVNHLNRIAVFNGKGDIIDGEIYTAKQNLWMIEKRLIIFEVKDHFQVGKNVKELMSKQDDQIHAFALATNIPVNIAYSLITIYATSDQDLIQNIETFASESKDMKENEVKMQSLVNELNKLVVFNDRDECIGGILSKLRQ